MWNWPNFSGNTCGVNPGSKYPIYIRSTVSGSPLNDGGGGGSRGEASLPSLHAPALSSQLRDRENEGPELDQIMGMVVTPGKPSQDPRRAISRPDTSPQQVNYIHNNIDKQTILKHVMGKYKGFTWTTNQLMSWWIDTENSLYAHTIPSIKPYRNGRYFNDHNRKGNNKKIIHFRGHVWPPSHLFYGGEKINFFLFL